MAKKISYKKNELKEGDVISFENFLSNNYGKLGTLERKINDDRLDAIEKMQVIKETETNKKII